MKRKVKDRRKTPRKEKAEVRVTAVIPKAWADLIDRYAKAEERDRSPFMRIHIFKPWVLEQVTKGNLSKFDK